jgi:hypothetical protein
MKFYDEIMSPTVLHLLSFKQGDQWNLQKKITDISGLYSRMPNNLHTSFITVSVDLKIYTVPHREDAISSATYVWAISDPNPLT